MKIAKGASLSLIHARVPVCAVAGAVLSFPDDGLASVDIVVEQGRLAWIGATGTRQDMPPGPDLDQSMVWPCPVDCHTHLDKSQVWARSPNPDGTFAAAGKAAHNDALSHQEPSDIRQRVEFQLKSAYAHGTCAIRTHVDARPQTFDTAFDVITDLADQWRDRITLQACPFTGPEEPFDWIEQLARKTAAHPPGILSAFLYTTPGLNRFLDRIFALADKYGIALDFHADENLDPNSQCLKAVAEAVLRNRFEGSVLVGHCCALSVQPPEVVDRTLDLVARAGIAIVSLPLCNTYLMDRSAGKTPRQRGFAPVHEACARGIPVAIGSDNVRDAFHAYGDLDLPELFRDALRMMHLDHPVGDWISTVTSTAADLMGLPGHGRIRVGAPADLILFPARNWSEFAARPQSGRVVLRNGFPIDDMPPDYRELDDLKGLHQ